jgi:hypothetical protein
MNAASCFLFCFKLICRVESVKKKNVSEIDPEKNVLNDRLRMPRNEELNDVDGCAM